jgi:hypothetical protein
MQIEWQVPGPAARAAHDRSPRNARTVPHAFQSTLLRVTQKKKCRFVHCAYYEFLMAVTIDGEPCSSFGIVTGYGLDGTGIESRWGRDSSHLSRPALGPTQPPVQRVPVFPGDKAGGAWC